MSEPRAGKGYRSPVNLGLPQIPQSQDPELFAELLPVFNACHTLNAYLDQLRLVLEGGDPTDTPAESLRFTKSFWIEAGETIEEGQVVSLSNGRLRVGADRSGGTITTPLFGFTLGGVNRFTGLALTSGAEGEMIRFGIGPAIIEVPGFKADQYAWATLVGELGAGQLFNERPTIPSAPDPQSVIVGFCIKNDFVMIIPNFVG